MVYKINIILFENFETLDVFGPVEILGLLPAHFEYNFISLCGGLIKSAQGVLIDTIKYQSTVHENAILFIPGGAGTRQLVNDTVFLEFIRTLAKKAPYILSVCTGSAILAKAGILKGKQATSNKRAFEWVTEQSDQVEWIKKARWIRDEHIFTSSGVSAGMDMTLGFIESLFGTEEALNISNRIEYTWQRDPRLDPFAELYPFTKSV